MTSANTGGHSGRDQFNAGRDIFYAERDIRIVGRDYNSAPDLTEVRHLLEELKQAFADSETPEDERQAAENAIEQLDNELTSATPRSSRVLISWNVLKTIATLNGVWAGWDHIQRLMVDLAPKTDAAVTYLQSIHP